MKITGVTAQGQEFPIDLVSLATAEMRETSRIEANRWIKRLRHVPYGHRTMRERFQYHGDSLWWFTELYLHKTKRIDRAVTIILALEAALEQLGPARIIVADAGAGDAAAIAAFCAAHRVPVDVRNTRGTTATSQWPSYLIGLTATLSRLRPNKRLALRRRPAVAAFLHTAFWRRSGDVDDPQQEGYIGPVLDSLAKRLPPQELFLVGVGPRRNFRARRWWDAMTPAPADAPPLLPIEQLAPREALRGALAVWRTRGALARELTDGDGIRTAASFHGCDLWPIVRAELHAVALLQWPWSVRAMDEAGAALDSLAPDIALTYAEAGGWGRALVLEARRRGIKSVGVQHGFIYRHWLNYLHEADEFEPAGDDRGAPVPDRTLLFDRFAADHLERAGRFPADRLVVTGNARLDELSARVAAIRQTNQTTLRTELGAGAGQQLAVLTAKFSEIKDEMTRLAEAVATLPNLRLIIKTHPAETPEAYAASIRGVANISVAPADADLARLLAAADAVVTMNSTVALDAMTFGVPSLVVGLPNNLSPFVDAGVMAGAEAGGPIAPALGRLLYDREVRARLAAAAEVFIDRFGMRPDGHAAARAAEATLALRGQAGGRGPKAGV